MHVLSQSCVFTSNFFVSSERFIIISYDFYRVTKTNVKKNKNRTIKTTLLDDDDDAAAAAAAHANTFE